MRISLLLAVAAAIVVSAGCDHVAPVKPLYRTTEGLIPPIAGASAKTIVVTPFDTAKICEPLGKSSSSILLGIGRLTTGNYVLTDGLSAEIARAFELQLKQAGFNVLRAPKPGDATPAADAVLSGAVTDLRLSRHNRSLVYAVDDEISGEVKLSATLTTPDGSTVLYQGETASVRRFNMGVMLHRSTATRTADEMLGAVIDGTCKAPAFQDALKKVAGG